MTFLPNGIESQLAGKVRKLLVLKSGPRGLLDDEGLKMHDFAKAMAKIHLTSSILILVTISFCTTYMSDVQASESNWSVEQQAVIDVAQSGVIGLKKGDNEAFEKWLSFYSPTYSYWEVGTQEPRTLSTQESRVRNYVNKGNSVIDFQLTPIDVLIHGDTAILRSISTESIRQVDGKILNLRFSAATVFVREDEKWLRLSTNIIYFDDE